MQESDRSKRGVFPVHQEVGDGGGLHAAHGLELAGPLAEKQFAMLAEDGECGNPLAQRNLIALRDIEVLVQAAYIDVNEDVVGVEDGRVGRVMEVTVEDMAIGTPIAAK